MCLYPKLIKNKRYVPNKKNNWKPPKCPDERMLYVTAACGKCYECRKQKARGWRVRMSEETKNNQEQPCFITLTIDDANYNEIMCRYDTEDDNEIATKCMRLFLERIRKETKQSVKHWFITELGHDNTERVHLHGIMWNDNAEVLCRKHWKYGFLYIGEYCNEKTMNYIIKYMTKPDEKHKEFNGKVLTSSGIGESYTRSMNAQRNRFKGRETNESFRLPSGILLNLPIYYRNKLYTDEQREILFRSKLDKGDIYVCGEKFKVDTEEQEYMKFMQVCRERYKKIMFDNETLWDAKKYERRLKKQREYYSREYKRLNTV